MIYSTCRYLSVLAIVIVSVSIIPAVAIDWASFDFSATYDEAPIAVITVRPEFPESAVVDDGSELLLAVLIDIEGKVGDAVIIEDDVAPEIAEAVIEAVLQNRYEPAKFHGEPVEIWYMISVPVTAAHKETERYTNSDSIQPKGLERK